jgi:hypothetical protein
MEKRIIRMGKEEIVPAGIGYRVNYLDVHYVKGYWV